MQLIKAGNLHKFGLNGRETALVIRSPYWWGGPNCTVLLSHDNTTVPVLTFNMDDIYGRATANTLSFAPHQPITVSSQSLGEYVGSLTDDEFAQVMEAFTWIHDIDFRCDKSHVPDIYKVYIEMPVPHVTSNTQIHENIIEEKEKKVDDVKRDEPMPEKVKVFPKSCFDNAVLQLVAGKFTIDTKYYSDSVDKRDSRVLSDDELKSIYAPLGGLVIDEVMEYYKKLTPWDACMLAPRLPLTKLADITKMSDNNAIALKRMCNILRDMPEDEYQKRMMVLKTQCRQATNSEIAKVKSYLTPKRVMSMPADVAKVFIKIPMYIVKRNWVGAQFGSPYHKAMAYYKKLYDTV